MYKKFDISKCNKIELERLNKFKEKNPNKEPIVYYFIDNRTELGFSLIATFEKPKKIRGNIKFNNYIDITDYDERVFEY